MWSLLATGGGARCKQAGFRALWGHGGSAGPLCAELGYWVGGCGAGGTGSNVKSASG